MVKDKPTKSSDIQAYPELSCRNRYKTSCLFLKTSQLSMRNSTSFSKESWYESLKFLEGFSISRLATVLKKGVGIVCRTPAKLINKKLKPSMEKENHLFKCPVFIKIPNLLWEEHSGHNPVQYFNVSDLRVEGEPCWIKVLAFLTSCLFLSPAGLQTRTHTPTFQEFPILAIILETTPPGYKSSRFCCQEKALVEPQGAGPALDEHQAALKSSQKAF